jgi:hypothetical protein
VGHDRDATAAAATSLDGDATQLRAAETGKHRHDERQSLGSPLASEVIAGPGHRPANFQPIPNMLAPVTSRASIVLRIEI